MEKILIVGNPNTGKSTLFNSLTKSEEHTGNWHGVTVDKKSKIVSFNDISYEIVDLPGLYSLNCYTMEEEVSKEYIFKNSNSKILFCADANTLERNIFLLTQLIELGFRVKLLINNYGYFKKRGGEIDIKRLKKDLNCDIKIIDARKEKLTGELLDFKDCKNSELRRGEIVIDDEKSSILRYKKIEKILSSRTMPKDIYGESKIDNFLFNPFIFLTLFFASFFFILYLTFFLIGPRLSSGLTSLINMFVAQPFMSVLERVNASTFVLKLFDEGVFSAGITICSFLPQICLLYLFLTILEESGLISRFAFLMDDLFSKMGLNGKVVYTLLMGFGCNTTATYTSKNMPDKNSKIKSCLITPFMSCTAKLPVYTVVASAILGEKNFLLIIGLYALGIILAFLFAIIYEKTILKSKSDTFLLEFPPLRVPSAKVILKTSLKTSKTFISKVFGVIFSMSIIIWLMKNVSFSFKFTTVTEKSILYGLSKLITPIFKPIGLTSPQVVATLIVGLVAKELIVSTMLIFNKVSTTQGLIKSLTISKSAIYFSFASGLSFLIFVLLYSPCVSTTAVMFKEAGWKYSLLGLVFQFLSAYFLSALVYQALSGNLLTFLVWAFVLLIFILSIKFLYNRIKNSTKNCSKNCEKCKNCKFL